MTSNQERTLVIVKPEGVHRGLVGEIIKRFESKGFKMVAMKFIQPSKEKVEEFFIDLKEKQSYAGLISHMSSGPIVPIVLEGYNAVKASLIIMGEGDPLYCPPGTIRGDYSMKSGRKICHGSKSIESASKAISFWFEDGELTNYDLGSSRWLYDDFSPTALHPSMADRLSDPKIKMAFNTFDKNDDGTINAGEFSLAMRELGFDMTFAEIKLLMKGVDADRNGVIDFFEFCTMVAMFDDVKENEEKSMNEEALKLYFRAFDEDGNGFISPIELRQVMIELGVEVTDAQIDEWIKKADVDGDGRVNYEEFFRLKDVTDLKEAILENVKNK